MTPKAKKAKPNWGPTDEQRADIVRLSKIGVPWETIATIIGTSYQTLVKHCRPELEAGKAECTGAYIGTLYQLANVEKVPSAVFFYLKTREGWREKDRPDEGQMQPPKLIFNRGPTRVSELDNTEDIKKAS